jgi:hypothetical protein
MRFRKLYESGCKKKEIDLSMGTSNIKEELPAGGVILSVPHSALISSRRLPFP